MPPGNPLSVKVLRKLTNNEEEKYIFSFSNRYFILITILCYYCNHITIIL